MSTILNVNWGLNMDDHSLNCKRIRSCQGVRSIMQQQHATKAP